MGNMDFVFGDGIFSFIIFWIICGDVIVVGGGVVGVGDVVIGIYMVLIGVCVVIIGSYRVVIYLCVEGIVKMI